MITYIRKFILTTLYKPYKSKYPTIIIGNLNVGGSGKTPFTIWLCNELMKKRKRIGIISSGYRSKIQKSLIVSKESLSIEVGDEAVLLKNMTDAVVVSGKCRVESTKLIERYDLDYIIHDDGLQHYQIGRDIELILDMDNKNNINTLLLPCGPYREIKSFHPESIYIKSNYYKKDFLGFFSRIANVYSCEKKDYLAITDKTFKKINLLTGIADTSLIISELKSHNIDIIEHSFRDHHQFSASDLPNNGLPILITEKDYVKIKNISTVNIFVLGQSLYPNEKLKNMVNKL